MVRSGNEEEGNRLIQKGNPTPAPPPTEAPAAVPPTPTEVPPTQEVQAQPKILRVAATASVTTWDPSASFSTEALYMANIYEPLIWEGRNHDYRVDLFLGWARGPLEDIAAWPAYGLTTTDFNDSVIGNLGSQTQMCYGGGYKTDLSASNATVVATYDYSGNYSGTANAICFTYGSGNGHILLIGTHPESRSGSNEDWIMWDNYVEGSNDPLVNPDNPWTFVDAAFDNWLIQ